MTDELKKNLRMRALSVLTMTVATKRNLAKGMEEYSSFLDMIEELSKMVCLLTKDVEDEALEKKLITEELVRMQVENMAHLKSDKP